MTTYKTIWKLVSVQVTLILLLIIAGCATSQSQRGIFGTWSEEGTATLLTFQADGMVKVTTGTEITMGTYSFEPPARLTLRFDGTTPRPGPHAAKCELRGDHMQLVWAEGGKARYTRLGQHE
ncbi:MAG: hypothetical protein U1F65_05585 [Verrucomicrobiota bacterium]